MNPDTHEGTNVRTRSLGRLARTVAPLILCAIVLPGCLKGQAKTVPDVPLDMPAPPPRVVEVSVPTSPLIVPLPEEPIRNTPPRPAPPQRTEVRPPEQKPDVVPVDQPRSEDVAKSGVTPTLQTAPAQQETEAERKIRALLGQATTDLNRINVQSLNTDARLQFETARRFVRQAEDALRGKNLVFANNLANKAGALAAQLSGR